MTAGMIIRAGGTGRAGSAQQTDDLSRVRLFGGGGPGLAKVLDQLNYRVERAHDEDRQPLGRERCVASIVSDEVDEPLQLCAALAPHHPVIMISDERSFAFRLAAAEAGISALIRRPVNTQELSDWLKYFAERGSSTPVSVLIVDDDWLTSELNAEVLRSSGITVKTVNDPTQAVAALEEAVPDLILMDLQMPGVDGITLARILRQSRQFTSLPIIFLSAERDEDRQMVARRLGGDDFIAKPVDPERLIALVKLRADRSKLVRSLIERDGLTGLYGHSAFAERLSLEFERCRRSDFDLSLVMVDIDRFKAINDTYGHPIGDVVIRTLSSVLVGGLRQIDIVGRCGGEEFGVILFGAEPRSAKIVIDKLRHRLRGLPFAADGREFTISFSAGVASSSDFVSAADLVAAADAALYQAKRLGRDRTELAGPIHDVGHAATARPRLGADGHATTGPMGAMI